VLRLAAFLLAALALRIVLFTGIQGADDRIYSRCAWTLSQGAWPEGDGVLRYRVGITAPLALLYRIFGSGEGIQALPSLAASMGLILLAGAWTPAASRTTAMLLVALLPLDLHLATMGQNDGPLAFWLGSALCLLLDERRSPRGRGLLAGAALVAGHLTKESALLLAAIPLALLLAQPTHRRAAAWSLAAAAIGLLLEAAAYGAFAGRPFLRYQEAAAAQGAIPPDRAAFAARWGYLPALAGWPYGGFLSYTAGLFAVAALAPLRGADLRLRAAVAAAWGALAILVFWPLRLWPYVAAVDLQPRMLAVAVVPAAVLASTAFRGRRIAVAAWCAIAVLGAVRVHRDSRQWRQGAIDLHARLSKEAPATVVTDPRTREALALLSGQRSPHRLAAYYAGMEMPEGPLLLAENPILAGLAARLDGVHPPPWWKVPGPGLHRLR
jgi:hypothetical protein